MSQKSITEKLFLKEGDKFLLLNQPADFLGKLGELPENVTILTETGEPVDVIQVFITSKREMEEKLPDLKIKLSPKGKLWITYPKGTSKVKTDVNRDIIAGYAQSIGLQPVAMIAIDDTWSALRLKVSN